MLENVFKISTQKVQTPTSATPKTTGRAPVERTCVGKEHYIRLRDGEYATRIVNVTEGGKKEFIIHTDCEIFRLCAKDFVYQDDTNYVTFTPEARDYERLPDSDREVPIRYVYDRALAQYEEQERRKAEAALGLPRDEEEEEVPYNPIPKDERDVQTLQQPHDGFTEFTDYARSTGEQLAAKFDLSVPQGGRRREFNEFGVGQSTNRTSSFDSKPKVEPWTSTSRSGIAPDPRAGLNPTPYGASSIPQRGRRSRSSSESSDPGKRRLRFSDPSGGPPPSGPTSSGLQQAGDNQGRAESVKIQSIPEYTGERGKKAREFIGKCELAFRDHTRRVLEVRARTRNQEFPRYISGQEKVEKVLSLCSEQAFDWASVYIENIDNRQWANSRQLYNWDEFRTAFLAQFSSVDPERSAERELQTLRQGNEKIAVHTGKFRNLASQTSWNDEAKIAWYRNTLGQRILDVMAASPNIPNDYETFLNWSIRIGENLEFNSQSRGGFGTGNNRSQPNRRNGGTFSSSNWRRNDNSGNGASTSNIRSRPNSLSPEENARYRKENLCFKCGMAGHIARNCRVRQGNNSGNSAQAGRNNGSYQGRQNASGTGMGDGNEDEPSEPLLPIQHTLRSIKSNGNEGPNDGGFSDFQY